MLEAAAIEWDYELGQVVFADIDEVYGLSADSKFEVVKRFLDEDGETHMYNLKSLDNSEIYEAYPSMIISIAD